MKVYALYILFVFSFALNAQQEFHVFPKDNPQTPGSETGDGSLSNPWDLQTALNQKPNVVKSGDTIWLHQGIYNGRYRTTIQSLEPNQYITVSGYKDDRVVLNGNVRSELKSVLQVNSKQVIFKNFEVTSLGEFSRDASDADFNVCSGIQHLQGENCWFYNLKIYDNPGLGIGSWKHAAGTIIENCMIYNNGAFSKSGKGGGEGIYVQNKSDEVRLIKNNIIYNNYYKGVEVWSAGKRADFQYVKNITLDGNIIFHSGSPSGNYRDNVIVGSADRNGINVAKNIKLLNNVLYHNTAMEGFNALVDAPSLTLGFNKNAPIEDVIVDGNIITGGYNGLRLLQIKSIEFKNNTIYTGNLQISPSMSSHVHDWKFDSNLIYSRLRKPFRVSQVKDYTLKAWQDTFKLDARSEVRKDTSFDLDKIVHKSQYSQDKNKFNLALFNAEGQDVSVDFSSDNLLVGQVYTIYDVENPDEILITGIVSDDFTITFPMQTTAFKKPLHNDDAVKTRSNFGVFIITFETPSNPEIVVEERESAFKRFFRWLGF